jgi:50S ribosomal subunit-associated GTPase HflX
MYLKPDSDQRPSTLQERIESLEKELEELRAERTARVSQQAVKGVPETRRPGPADKP